MNTLLKKITSVSLIVSLIGVLCSCGNEESEDDNGIIDLTDPEIFNCDDCTLVLDIETGIIDADELGIEPGSIICLNGAAGIYHHMTFQNLKGTNTNPIIIRNCNEQAIIESEHSFGVKFAHSEHFKILGDGHESYLRGIKISTTKGFFLTMEQLSTNFEIAQVEIAGFESRGIGENNGFAGIGIKTSPYQECDLFTDESRIAWIMEDVTVRDCYIHDTGGEGLYIGHGFYNGRVESSCSQMTYSHSIHNISIHDNIIKDIGYDGIQIKNCDLNCELYNNIVLNYGQLDEGAHNEGLFIGGGTTGKFYNNIIIGGTGHGIQFQGMGNNDIYNNLIVDSGDNGFFGSNGDQIYRIPDGYFNIVNNTIIKSGKNGFAFFNGEGGVKRLYNNIIAESTDDIMRKGAQLDSSDNIVTQDLASLSSQLRSINEDNYCDLISLNIAIGNEGFDVSTFMESDVVSQFKSNNGFSTGANPTSFTCD